MKPVAPRSRPLVEAGAASVADILMNLFIFFFIAFSLLATFDKRKKESAEERLHDLELPASAGGNLAPEPSAVVVELAADGDPRVDGEPVAPSGLTRAVREAMSAERRSVVVRADRRLSLGSAVAQLDSVWAAEPQHVSIATSAAEGADRAASPERPRYDRMQ